MLRNLKKAIKKLVLPDLIFKLHRTAGEPEKLGSSYAGWVIEGAEFEVIDSIAEDNVNIKILCIEFHLMEKQGLQKIQPAIKKLEENSFAVCRENFDFTFINKNYLH
jgi:RNA polymerase-binding transcription factor DksA